MALMTEGQYLRVRLSGVEDAFPTLLDVSGFLYDFNLLYEFMRLSVDPAHHDFRFSQYAYYRNGRPLKDNERLHVESLRMGSPIVLSAVVAIVSEAIVVVGAVVGIVERVQNASLNKRKLRAEVEKLERENRGELGTSLSQAFEGDVDTVRRLVRIRESEHFVDGAGRRLEKSLVRVKEIEIEVVDSRTLNLERAEREQREIDSH
jgi:hypothetical protein